MPFLELIFADLRTIIIRSLFFPIVTASYRGKMLCLFICVFCDTFPKYCIVIPVSKVDDLFLEMELCILGEDDQAHGVGQQSESWVNRIQWVAVVVVQPRGTFSSLLVNSVY